MVTVTYQQPPHGYPPATGKATPRLPLVVGSVIAAVLVVAVVVAVVLANSDGSDEATPQPISRTELVAAYTDLVPGDSTATASAVVDLANTTCEQLDGSVSVNDLIASTAAIYGGRDAAREVLRVLVSYGCPGNLDVFE
jgi:hypothetical protein